MENDFKSNVDHQRFMRPKSGDVKINQNPRPKPPGSYENWKEETIDKKLWQKQDELKQYESSMDSYRQVVKEKDKIPNVVILNSTTDNKKTHSYIRYVIGLIFVAILLFSNPSEDAHRQAVINITVKKNGISDVKGEFFNNLKTAVTYYSTVEVAPMMIFRRNYILFSITEMKFNGEKKDIGIGILGTVILYVELENWIKDLIE